VDDLLAMKRYTVTGSQPVLDHQPGESFDADLPADQEEFLVGSGALAISQSVQVPGTSKSVEFAIKNLNVKSYNVNGPREERPR
jgi:hypothetical protein